LVSNDAVNFCILPVLAQTAAHSASALDPEVFSGFILSGTALLTGIFLLYVR
jgi:Mg2+/citrate symporter